jgi:formiminotetrahydrofolate cyclodeaminase
MAGAEAAWYNVLINLNGIDGDAEWVQTTRKRADEALSKAEAKAAALRKLVRDRLRAGA